jgi:hypothetical protein
MGWLWRTKGDENVIESPNFPTENAHPKSTGKPTPPPNAVIHSSIRAKPPGRPQARNENPLLFLKMRYTKESGSLPPSRCRPFFFATFAPSR